MVMLTENWRPVARHPNYEVSSLGRVRSLPRWVFCGNDSYRWYEGRILRPTYANHGYPSVKIAGKTLLVHSLVAEAFIGPRPQGMDIRHLDGDRRNPNVSNLRYGTRAENCQDTMLHGRWSNGRSHRNDCHLGHSLVGDNLYINPRGERQCRACNSRRVQEYRRRKREKSLCI